MVIGMILYLSPYPITPMHWGWDKLHDLCFECKKLDQLWRPITKTTVVAHHVASWTVIQDVHKKIHDLCDDECQKAILPFEIQDLDDLCSRNPRIPDVYAKCKYSMSDDD